MIKTVLKIDGMACGMCEAHVNDAIRKAFTVKGLPPLTVKERPKSLQKRLLTTIN